MAKRIEALGGVVLVAVIVVVVVVATAGSGSSHRLTATFDSATNLVSGARVTAGGVPVGSVGSITLQNGLAAVQLNITDDKVWPLPQGTRAEIRWGGTVSYSNRYVELLPGSRSDPPLRSGARLPTADTVTPVEFDQLFNVFSAPARQSLGALVDNSATTFEGRAGELRDGLNATPPALQSVASVLHDLGEDPLALETLVGSGATTAQALAAQQSHLIDLVDGAATTFSTIAAHAATTQQTLAKLPPALQSAQTMLRQLDPTLTKLNGLIDTLHPGAERLAALASPLSHAITTLGTVAPVLNGTLADVQHGAPAVTKLLTQAKPLLQSTKPALTNLSPMLACLRTETPEFAGFITTWESMGSYYDDVGHYARVLAQAFTFPNDNPETPSQIVTTTANLLYSLVRPPGFSAGQSWLQQQCGYDAAGTTAAEDPETHP